MEKLKKVSSKLGYYFNNDELLALALSHRSFSHENNERLEFLGDSVLGIIISEELYKQFPKVKEGKLSRFRSSLVKGDTLADIAQELNLGDFLFLGGGELKSGGYRRASILADALEAIIGAIFIDADFTTVRECVINWYKNRIKNVDQLILKDPKSRLQEFLQARKFKLPHYTVSKIEGKDHNQTFHIKCSIDECNVMVTAIGHSRRSAEQQAAELLLTKLDKLEL